jgi:hypothetical protein
MEKLERYRALAEKVIRAHSQPNQTTNFGIEYQAIIDHANGHYQSGVMGWRGNKRIRGATIHIDLKDGKFWIQHDGTEVGVANELVEMGVPKEDIVLAFYAPYRRQFTEFAVA